MIGRCSERRIVCVFTAAFIAATLLSALPYEAARAEWLAQIARRAGRAAGVFARDAATGLDQAAAYVKLAPAVRRETALAATVSAEGHWTFVNAAGETFTAGNADELKRVATVLLPGNSPEQRLTLYLTEEAAFDQRAELAKLPMAADLQLVSGGRSYPLVRKSMAGEALLAEVRSRLFVALDERRIFHEVLWQLDRPLLNARLRVAALEPGGPEALPLVPKLEGGRAAVDVIDPYKLAEAMRSIPGQTVVVAGRIDGRLLYFRAARGPERSLILEDLIKAAEAADVNFVVLHSATPRQPGGRNWLWLRVNVAGLDDALGRATMSDFLDALPAGQGPLRITAAERGGTRLALRALPLGVGEGTPPPGGFSGMLSEMVSEVTGRVVATAIEADLASSGRLEELDARIVPGIPSDVQFGYLGLMLAGILGLPVAWLWWGRLWPAERRAGYSNALGFHLARSVRLLFFVLVFLPVSGIPAALSNVAMQLWMMLTFPFRFFRRLLKPEPPQPA